MCQEKTKYDLVAESFYLKLDGLISFRMMREAQNQYLGVNA